MEAEHCEQRTWPAQRRKARFSQRAEGEPGRSRETALTDKKVNARSCRVWEHMLRISVLIVRAREDIKGF